MADTAETTPLLSPSADPPRPPRTVTFNPQTTISHPNSAAALTSPLRPAPVSSPTFPSPQYSFAGQVKVSNSNGRLRRRNSHGSPLSAPPMVASVPKIGPQRTTKNTQKLKLLPTPDPGDDGPDEESGREVYSQFTKIKDPTARRDAAKLGKADRDKLPRVTAYCTASSYQIPALMRFLKGRGRTRGANPKQFDECVYSPYNYKKVKADKGQTSKVDNPVADTLNGDGNPLLSRQRRYSDSAVGVDESRQQRRGELIDTSAEAENTMLENGESSEAQHRNLDTDRINGSDFDTEVHTAEVFLFEYGTVVIWGMDLQQEQRFLNDISKFENEKLSEDNVQTENFNFYYTREYQARIYNDFISLREKTNYMTKLAISHALAQSVKTSLFEDLLSTTISSTSPIPEQIATTGRIALTRREITMQIGQLFILRINIHLQGSVLDSPELMWAEPQLEPVYGAVRSYLEMDQRVGLLTERLDVIADLLSMLKEQVRTSHGESLEWIVIILIAAEILVAAINIVVDLYAGVD
ncbi:hypothetical protein MMC07_002864 [Pseudocyphellaria aurata]|nr:hypothetical protein [Pseudocyphellaria aurata]